ncbi:MAG: fibronectin type III domain-containing protein [Bacteroidia bacterium]
MTVFQKLLKIRISKKLIKTFGLLLFIPMANAQTSISGSIQIIGKTLGDSVILRWAPSSYLSWKEVIAAGFTVERSEFAKDTSEILKKPFKVIKQNIKCLSLDQMKKTLGPKSEYGAVAAQAIYGANFKPSLDKASDFKNASIEQKNRFGFAMFAAENDAQVAKAIGLRWVDYTAKKGYYYVYKIYSNLTNPETLIDTGFCVVSTMPKEKGNFLPELKIENLQNAIKLNWNIENYQDIYSGYFLEKRKLGTTVWTRLNKIAMIRAMNEENPEPEMFYTDSVKENYVKYQYRLVGLTPFAENLESETLMLGFGRDLTPPSAPEKIEIEGTSDYLARLLWTKSKMEKDFAGFHIQKAYFADGPFATISETILPKTAKSYIDKNYDPYTKQYYRVVALDTANNASVSMSIYAYFADSIAPIQPLVPKGNISKQGITKLSWNLGKENDIKGYRVYRANQADHEFINITPYPITDTVFYDTISLTTLTKKIYYKISAVDYHFNHSEQSEALELKRPDIIKPANPVFQDILVSDSSVMLQWFNSPSDDVKQTWLLRKTNDKKVEVISKFNGVETNNFTDKKIVPGNTYYYFLLAIDENNLLSDTSHPVDAMIYKNKLKPAVTNFSATKSASGKSINLTWNSQMGKDRYFVIYRKKDNESLVSYKHTDGNTLKFEDTELVGKGNYSYAIVTFFLDGSQSAMSELKTVSIN